MRRIHTQQPVSYRFISGVALLFIVLVIVPAYLVIAAHPVYQPAAEEGRIAFVSRRDGNPDIYVMNADGSAPINLSSSDTSLDLYPDWSPDGTRIVFTSNRLGNNYEIYTFNSDGTTLTRLTDNATDDTWPAWSPDGSFIAFNTLRDGNFEVYRMNSDGSTQVNLSNHPGEDIWPAWSPDGSRLAFASNRSDEQFDIYVMNADGSDLTRLTSNPAQDSSPAWSPDGTRIAFSSNRDGETSIYVMNADGSDLTRLTSADVVDGYPAWAPDGTRIVFTSNRDGNDELYVMNADGSAQARLTNSAEQDTYAAWGIAGSLAPAAPITTTPEIAPAAPITATLPAAPAADAFCFPETGYCITGRIREFWEQNGGLAVFGLPITEQREEMIEGQSLQVQWFERNRLELHPENARPYDVLLGRLGIDRLEQQGRDWSNFPKAEPLEGCRFFPETEHNVCGDMLTMWEQNGLELDGVAGKTALESLSLFGLPLSEPQLETLGDGEAYSVQWFERARFELHLENDPPYHILLGLLGTEVLTARTTPMPKPTLIPVVTPVVRPTATATTPLFLPTSTPTYTPGPTFTPTYTPGPTFTPTATATPAPTATATPLPTFTPTPRITWASARIRFVNETYGELNISVYGPSQGHWSLGLDETVEVAVVPGDYRIETTTICGDNTREYFVGHLETREDKYECSVNAP